MNNNIEIEYRSTEEIIPYARNARTHSKDQIRQIARSIETFGFINPILVDESGTLVAGHARVLAARQLGLNLIPTISVAHLNEAEKRAYILADNKIAENAGWDENLLRVELKYLSHIDLDFDVDLTGFSMAETDLLLGAAETLTDEAIPELPHQDEVATRPGDVWLLGPHHVICGDCRDSGVMEQLMDGSKASLVLTDPPYNVRVDGHVSGLGQHKHREFAMASGEMNISQYTDFLGAALGQFARASTSGSLHYIFIDWRHVHELYVAGIRAYEEFINLCVWVKNNGGMGSLYRSQHELVLVFKSGKDSHQNNVELGRHGRYRTNVWNYPGVNSFGSQRDESLAMHPTVKPVQMLADAILDATRRGEIVLDGFLGSGSTLIAAEAIGRICYGVELDPAYVDVIVERYERATGFQAARQSDGYTIQEVRQQRSSAQVIE